MRFILATARVSMIDDCGIMQNQHELTRVVARERSIAMVRIRNHDPWAAACVLNPGFRSFSFAPAPDI